MQWINDDLTFLLLEKALDVCALRHKVIANNIANVDTPGFRGSRVIFEEKLREALEGNPLSTDVEEIEPQLIKDEEPTPREDLNNVDIEREMVRLSENALKYNIYAQILITKLGIMRAAIQGK